MLLHFIIERLTNKKCNDSAIARDDNWPKAGSGPVLSEDI